MKKYFILSAVALMGALTACNDSYINDIDYKGYTEADVKVASFELTNEMYSAIAVNADNKALAEKKDNESGTGTLFQDALKAVGSKHVFSTFATAEDYLPAYLKATYPQADLGSKFTVTYQTDNGTAEYLQELAAAKEYTLNADDYASVWGKNLKANFLTPTTVSKLPALLKEAMPDAAEGDLVAVNYAYSKTEPSVSTGGEVTEPTWNPISPNLRAANTSFDYYNIGAVDLSEYKGQTITIGFKYTSSADAYGTWEIRNFRAGTLPYMDVMMFKEQTDGSFKMIKNKDFGAGKYIIASLSTDGKYYPFGNTTAWTKNYAYFTPGEIAVTDGVITADAAGDYVIDIQPSATTEGAYTFKNGAYYLYASAKSAGGFNNNFNRGESLPETTGGDWTISSTGSSYFSFQVKNVLSEYNLKYLLYNGNKPEYAIYPEDSYAKYTLAELSFSTEDGNGGFTTNNEVDWTFSTKQYGWVGKHNAKEVSESWLYSTPIYIPEDAVVPYFTLDEAIRYAGSVEDMTFWISTDYASLTANARSAATRAADSVNPTNAVLYQFNGSAWVEYSKADVKTSVFAPADYEALGSKFIASSSVAHVLSTYLANKYPYAADGDVAAVVYHSSASAISAAEFKFDGSVWNQATGIETETINMTLGADGYSAKLSVFIEESFLQNATGGFQAYNVALDGLTYIWSTTATYGWKGSCHANGACHNVDSYLVSPSMNFKNATAPKMAFEECVNYMTVDLNKYLKVLVSTNFAGDPTSCTWVELTDKMSARGDGASWNFFESGQIDLSEFAGNTNVVVAFRYMFDMAEGQSCATWEIKNLKIAEPEEFE